MKHFALAASALLLSAAVAAAQEAIPPTPAPPQQEEPKPQAQPEPAVQEPEGTAFINLDRLEVAPRVGLAAFSEDFEADPEFAFGILARAPLPWLSRDLFGLEADDFGAYLDFTVTSIDRDIDLLEDPDGTLFFAGAGLDFAFLQDDTWLAQIAAGLQYGNFGGVTDLDDGVALLLGLTGGVQVSEGIRVTLAPQIAFGNGGDQVYFVHLGVQIAF